MKKFHYTTIISAVDGRLVAKGGFSDVVKLFEHVTQTKGVTTLAMLYLSKPMEEFIGKHHPWAKSAKVKAALTKLIAKEKFSEIDSLILPLAPEEWLEVPTFTSKQTADTMKDYGPWLKKTLDGKTVVTAVVK